jgi:hypothetical protein
MYKNKDLKVFVRFGGVNLKTQKGYQFNPTTFHKPPTRRGFYAMPKIVQEYFLLGSINEFQPGTIAKIKDNEDYFDWDKKRRKSMSLRRKEFKKVKGFIWHHLSDYCDMNEIITIHGSWVKTTIHHWEIAFKRMSIKLRYGESKQGFDFSIKSINEARGIMGFYSKDHCEVFFDEKV